MATHCDVAIVGGGISGMFAALQIKTSRPDLAVVIFERDPRLGGKLASKYDADGRLMYERGPWRINAEHEEALGLAADLGLHVKPAPSEGASKINLVESAAADEADEYAGSPPPLCEDVPAALSTWAADALRHGVRYADDEGYRTGYGPRLQYEARGGNAYELSGNDQRYYVLQEGLSSIATRLAAVLERSGVEVRLNTRVLDVARDADKYVVICSTRDTDAYTCTRVSCDKCCLALPLAFAESFAIYPHLRPGASQLDSIPLVHIYAPVNPDLVRLSPGFHINHRGLGGQIISSNSAAYPAHIQVAYAGGESAHALQQLALCDPARLRRFLEQQLFDVLARLPALVMPGFVEAKVGDLVVGEPDVCFWAHAIHHWRPTYGLDLPTAAAQFNRGPHPGALPHLVCCGEAGSLHQGWIEGALRTAKAAATELLQHAPLIDRLPRLLTMPAEWIVFDEWLIDVTKWKDVHPGSKAAIEHHLYEDCTDLFRHIKHTGNAYAILGALRVGVRRSPSDAWMSLPSRDHLISPPYTLNV